jgi:hypothetical protein
MPTKRDQAQRRTHRIVRRRRRRRKRGRRSLVPNSYSGLLRAWVRGLKLALTGPPDAWRRRLRVVLLVLAVAPLAFACGSTPGFLGPLREPAELRGPVADAGTGSKATRARTQTTIDKVATRGQPRLDDWLSPLADLDLVAALGRALP